MYSRVLSRRRMIQGGAALASAGLLAGCGGIPFLAARPTRMSRIGFLSSGSSDPLFDAGFSQGLWEHGRVDGQNVTIEGRYAEGQEARLADLAAELVRFPVDVIVTLGGPAALAAQRATATIPIVAISGQQVGTGLVTSLARPDGNLTGLRLTFEGLISKKMELLNEAVPGVRRVAVLSIVNNPAHEVGLRELQGAAQKLGVQVQSLAIRGPDDAESAFDAATRGQVDGLIVQDDPNFIVQRARIVDAEGRYHLPAMHGRREWAEAGGLMAHGVNLSDVFRRAAGYVDRTLLGARPAELPVERPTTFDFVINLRTARALGLTIPPSILQQATEVLQ